MAEELPQPAGTTPNIFEMDQHAEVDLDSLQTEVPPEDTGRASDPPQEPEGESDGLTLEKPDELPPELLERWEATQRRMQRSYNKARTKLESQARANQQKADMVDRFYQDRAYAAQTIQQMAQQLGMQLVPVQGQGAPPATPPPAAGQGSGAMPAEYQRLVEETMRESPDLAFLAPIIGKLSWAMAQATTQQHLDQQLKPLQEEAMQRRQADQKAREESRQAEFAAMAKELADEGIDWEEHDEEMEQRLEFLRKALSGEGSYRHPEYGSILRLMYDWAAGPRKAQARAGRQLQRALTNRTSQGTAARSPGVNTDQLIREAPNFSESVRLAWRSAMQELPTTMRGR